MENTSTKKQNFLIRLWHYFSTYEKIWLFTLCIAGITLSILFPGEIGWLRIFEIITLIGGCTCELLVSKQSKWCFIISFFFYDLTETVIYIADGYYISALFEVIFWMPILFISFFSWNKRQDTENKNLTQVKGINWKRDLTIFIVVLSISILVGLLFTGIEFISDGFSEFWYLDALANTFSVCNGLFLWLRYKEQWLPWFGVCVVEAIMWILAGNWIMLILSFGYLTNTTYGLIMWRKYVNTHKDIEARNDTTLQAKDNTKEEQLQSQATEKIENNPQ